MNAILQMIIASIPVVTNLITVLRHKDGTTSVVVYLDEADAQFAANQKQLADWAAARTPSA